MLMNGKMDVKVEVDEIHLVQSFIRFLKDHSCLNYVSYEDHHKDGYIICNYTWGDNRKIELSPIQIETLDVIERIFKILNTKEVNANEEKTSN